MSSPRPLPPLMMAATPPKKQAGATAESVAADIYIEKKISSSKGVSRVGTRSSAAGSRANITFGEKIERSSSVVVLVPLLLVVVAVEVVIVVAVVVVVVVVASPVTTTIDSMELIKAVHLLMMLGKKVGLRGNTERRSTYNVSRYYM